MIPLDQLLAGFATFCAVLALALVVLLLVAWATGRLFAPRMRTAHERAWFAELGVRTREEAMDVIRGRQSTRAAIEILLSRLAWRAQAHVVAVPLDLSATIITPHPLVCFPWWRERVRQRALLELSRVAPAWCCRAVRVTHPLAVAWAQLRTAMLFRLPAGRGCGPRTRRVVGVDIATGPDRTLVTAVHMEGNTITRIDQRELAPRPSAEELAKFMRETSLRPGNHSEKLNSSPAPEPASPWDEEITKVVTIVDPTEGKR